MQQKSFQALLAIVLALGILFLCFLCFSFLEEIFRAAAQHLKISFSEAESRLFNQK